MRDADLRASGTLRPSHPATSGIRHNHNSGGFSSPVSGNGWRALWPRLAWMDGVVSATGIANQNTGVVSGGREHASGGRCANGGVIGTAGGAAPARGPRFNAPIPPGGYLWWYLDGISDDKQHAITLIAFVGSVFSPYYAWSGRRNPLNHCAINVALYGKPGARWTMTERPESAVARNEHSLRIWPSSLHWSGDVLEIDLDEIGAPIPKRVRGKVRVTPSGFSSRAYVLDNFGRHVWQPIAPRAQIELTLTEPRLSWKGSGYFDSNFGSEPLEAGLKQWTWSRAHVGNDTVVFYDAERRDNTHAALALRFDANGGVSEIDAPPLTALPRTKLWRIPRSTRHDANAAANVRQTLEDTPFYARSIIDTSLYRKATEIFHESLLLDRLRLPVVRAMLPFRMPRQFF